MSSLLCVHTLNKQNFKSMHFLQLVFTGSLVLSSLKVLNLNKYKWFEASILQRELGAIVYSCNPSTQDVKQD